MKLLNGFDILDVVDFMKLDVDYFFNFNVKYYSYVYLSSQFK